MTISRDAMLIRQYDLIPQKILGEKITVIGTGAIGGWVTLSLAKMGFNNINVYDFDTVSVENMNSQFFKISDIGRPKVEALQDLVREFTGVEIGARKERYSGQKIDGLVISAVDSMTSRKEIWDFQIGPMPPKFVIDPRMGAESCSLYVMNPSDRKDRVGYRASLYTDENALSEPCTAKATIYGANLLAGLVVKAVKDVLISDDPLRIVQWDISKNDYIAFTRSGARKGA